MSEAHFRKLEAMYLGAPISRLYQPSITIADGEATVGIPVQPDFFHAAGALHGSVLFKLLDDACFFAAASRVEDVFVLTAGFTCYFTRPVLSGRLTSSGRVVHGGRNLILAEAVVREAGGKEVARGSGSFLRSQTPLGPALGYR